MTISLIFAMADRRVIGYQGDMPWRGRLPGDLPRFKRLTMGRPVIMGRKTYESLGRPLKQRRNLVVSRQPNYTAEGCEVVGSFEAAVALAEVGLKDDDEIFVIGGAEIYAAALPLADRLYCTRVLGSFPGDTFFPSLTTDKGPKSQFPWRVVEHKKHIPSSDKDVGHVFTIRERGSS